ncbi:hypothetical protein BDY19DRAFT_924224 [Irpex rosettiformis]|uniref:Uncharacterized protein n=1 Tax=Irpex rosettiformis TaxID=378272 RepID=A0ACB8UDM5_9APHY|nr:hypothetical protein BDY19DRAFT_924224 [Irpex rosettiformis]
MALQPSLSPLIIVGSSAAPHTLEFFLDYVCPYSAKIALSIDNILKPLFDANGKYANQTKIIFRNQVQPWHGTSTFVHEASLAVARVAPEQFWPFSLALFKAQDDYFDIPSSDLTPKQIRQKLADLAAPFIGNDKKDSFLDLLALKLTSNGGVAVTDDLKYTIKYSRQNGIHVSPTVLFDGLVVNEISSGWSEDDWNKWLASKL